MYTDADKDCGYERELATYIELEDAVSTDIMIELPVGLNFVTNSTETLVTGFKYPKHRAHEFKNYVDRIWNIYYLLTNRAFVPTISSTNKGLSDPIVFVKCYVLLDTSITDAISMRVGNPIIGEITMIKKYHFDYRGDVTEYNENIHVIFLYLTSCSCLYITEYRLIGLIKQKEEGHGTICGLYFDGEKKQFFIRLFESQLEHIEEYQKIVSIKNL